jgi:hypothetical protein
MIGVDLDIMCPIVTHSIPIAENPRQHDSDIMCSPNQNNMQCWAN